jgi:hypothetical protein
VTGSPAFLLGVVVLLGMSTLGLLARVAYLDGRVAGLVKSRNLWQAQASATLAQLQSIEQKLASPSGRLRAQRIT